MSGLPPSGTRAVLARSGCVEAPQLALTFAASAGRTYVAQQRATHPFHLGRTLSRPDDRPGLATVYIQGCAGGLFEGDRVALTLAVERGARAHVTTSASTIVHRMRGGDCAEQDVLLTAHPDALLEYVPDPLIMFPRSRLRSRLCIRHQPGARVIAVDGFLAHQLPDDDSPFEWLDASTRIEDGVTGALLARERFVARGSELARRVRGVTGDYACQGTALVLGCEAMAASPLRSALYGLPDVLAGVSSLPSGLGLLVRVLARDAAALRRALHAAWSTARAELGEQSARPRPK